ncbi:MAG: hypothetical protein HDS50_00125 [Bacteroides sp.]|nr:hypothetical protein [Bacteroides sp.]
MITDEKTWEKSADILALMQDGMTVGQFLDALVLAQCSILSVVPTHKAIREFADEIREKIIANTTFIKAKNERWCN